MADEDLTLWEVAAETKEWVGPMTVTADGAPVSAFEVAVTEGTKRPTTWRAPLTLEGQRGVLVGVETDWPLAVGKVYTVWIRFTDQPERPVERIGSIKVT